jgi:molybdopterin-guanine dinucleotide biosynthesis protein A
MIAALRAHPDAAWLIVGCDMPRISTSAIDWLLGQRGSAYSAILPSVSPGCAEPLLAIYEPAARAALDELAREPDASPRRLAGRPNVRTVIVPDDLRDAWTNVNTPDEWERERRRQPHGLA